MCGIALIFVWWAYKAQGRRLQPTGAFFKFAGVRPILSEVRHLQAPVGHADVSMLLQSQRNSVHYLTYRPDYESALLAELKCQGITATTPHSAVARIEAQAVPDPAYALQVLPYAVEIRASSAKTLAEGAAVALGATEANTSDENQLRSQKLLQAAPRGSLVIQVLVPEFLRGAPPAKAKMFKRCEGVADKLASLLRRRFEAARTRRDDDQGGEAEQLQLQLLLLEPELLVVSLAPSTPHHSGIGYWPVRQPGGLFDCTLDGDMPSSAYRKLLESFEVMHTMPQSGERCVDLGACPGGWTGAIRRQCGAHVTAVDRQPLAPALMDDPEVTFVQGDAFTFKPEDGQVDWMVSDVAAFPDRCIELVDIWCRNQLACRMVLTMKFTGEPDFDAINAAHRVANDHGFRLRCMHHFSNKNEVMLMLIHEANL